MKETSSLWVLFETLAHSKKQLPNEQLGEICSQIIYLTHFLGNAE